MKLWLCSANCTDYEPIELHIAETEDEAIQKMADNLDNECIWYASISAEVIEIVDGFGIDVIS
jgi:hypothetical protein